jgi:hypothetical protein
MLAVITPIEGGQVDNSLPGAPGYPSHGLPGIPGVPSHPIVLPPLPGVYPPPGTPTQPIYLPPPGQVENPIVIPGSPEHPIALPPGSVWPPLPPSATGKYAVLVYVVGVGYRWFVVQGPEVWPPVAEPK